MPTFLCLLPQMSFTGYHSQASRNIIQIKTYRSHKYVLKPCTKCYKSLIKCFDIVPSMNTSKFRLVSASI